MRAIGAGGLNYTGRVGGSGSYNIVGVRPGAYTMSLSQADFRPTECDYQVEVPLGGCGVASAFMNPDGRVLGRLQSSDGETPPPVVIQLISYAMGKCRLTMRWRQPARHTFVWSDGRPAPFIHIWCSARGYLPIVHEITDKSGRIDFDVLDGLTYEVGGAASSDYEPVERRRYFPSRSA